MAQQPRSTKEFAAAARASRLVSDEQLIEAVEHLRPHGGRRRGVPVQLTAEDLGQELVARGILSPWQLEQLVAGKPERVWLGKCRLISLLARGGMSELYLARHVGMNRNVVVKVLPADRSHEGSHRERFIAEAQAAARLDHPNIIRVFAFDRDEVQGLYYMVFEFVAGMDLHQRVMRDGPLPCETAADYMAQAADGLAHAHLRGVIHRDIKPGNLLVDEAGKVRILDLGLARQRSRANSITLEYDDKILGTVDYLAPEQAMDSHKVDPRADLYSLGCTLFFVVTGVPPFRAGAMTERLLQHAYEPAPLLTDLRPDVPDALVQVCLRLMSKRPGDRYKDAKQAAFALRACFPRLAQNTADEPVFEAGVNESEEATRIGSQGDVLAWDAAADRPDTPGPGDTLRLKEGATRIGPNGSTVIRGMSEITPADDPEMERPESGMALAGMSGVIVPKPKSRTKAENEAAKPPKPPKLPHDAIELPPPSGPRNAAPTVVDCEPLFSDADPSQPDSVVRPADSAETVSLLRPRSGEADETGAAAVRPGSRSATTGSQPPKPNPNRPDPNKTDLPKVPPAAKTPPPQQMTAAAAWLVPIDADADSSTVLKPKPSDWPPPTAEEEPSVPANAGDFVLETAQPAALVSEEEEISGIILPPTTEGTWRTGSDSEGTIDDLPLGALCAQFSEGASPAPPSTSASALPPTAAPSPVPRSPSKRVPPPATPKSAVAMRSPYHGNPDDAASSDSLRVAPADGPHRSASADSPHRSAIADTPRGPAASADTVRNPGESRTGGRHGSEPPRPRTSAPNLSAGEGEGRSRGASTGEGESRRRSEVPTPPAVRGPTRSSGQATEATQAAPVRTPAPRVEVGTAVGRRSRPPEAASAAPAAKAKAEPQPRGLHGTAPAATSSAPAVAPHTQTAAQPAPHPTAHADPHRSAERRRWIALVVACSLLSGVLGYVLGLSRATSSRAAHAEEGAPARRAGFVDPSVRWVPNHAKDPAGK